MKSLNSGGNAPTALFGLFLRSAEVESKLKDLGQELRLAYQEELQRERTHLVELANERRFLRGIALGRPGLAQKIYSELGHIRRPKRHDKLAKWEQSLLRFATRTAIKLSANSTLTSYALGSCQEKTDARPLCFREARYKELSLVRLDRPPIEQIQALLLKHPSVREHCYVACNETVEEMGPHSYRYLRDGHWEIDQNKSALQFTPSSRVRVEIAGNTLNAAQELLAEGRLRYSELSSRLSQRTEEDCESARVELDRLCNIGILCLLPPWPSYGPRLEENIVSFLQSIPHIPDLSPVTEGLTRLLSLEEAYPHAAQPDDAAFDLRSAFSETLAATFSAIGYGGALNGHAHFQEDVVFISEGSDQGSGIVRFSQSLANELLDNASLLSRFAAAFNHRHDALHTLAGWWRNEEPNRRKLPFLELAQKFGKVWRSFLDFSKTSNESALSTFNPLLIDSIELLQNLRRDLLIRSEELIRRSPQNDFISSNDLKHLLDSLPDRYKPLVGPCIFVQPAHKDQDLWVLNRLHEGTGRYLSRITPALSSKLETAYLENIVSRSRLKLQEEDAEFLEILQPAGNLASSHSPQAFRVLNLRGLNFDLDPDRQVNLSDLVVEADLGADSFRLTDRSGSRFLPVQLSSRADASLTPLLRLLLTFGTCETRGVFPFALSIAGDHPDTVKRSSRLRCDRLIFRRRRWTVDISDIRERVANSDPDAYAAIQSWREQAELPQSGFYYEHTFHGSFKPQFIEFSSPSLCTIFVSSLQRKSSRWLIFEEALPTPADFPDGFDGNSRGVELMIDCLATAL